MRRCNSFVSDGSFVDHHIGCAQFSFTGKAVRADECFARLDRKHWVVQNDDWQPGDGTADQLLDTGMLCAERGDRTAVATHAGQPEGMHLRDRPGCQSECRCMGIRQCNGLYSIHSDPLFLAQQCGAIELFTLL